MRTPMLTHVVQTLRLRPSAPFPGQWQDVKQMIKDWRAQQRLSLVKAKAERNE